MYAISHGRYDIATLLLDYGANIDGKRNAIHVDEDMKTPLDWACMRITSYRRKSLNSDSVRWPEDDEPYASDLLSFVRYLLKMGADPSMLGRFKFLLNEDDVKVHGNRDLSKLLIEGGTSIKR